MQPVLLYPRRSRFAPKLCFADRLLKSIFQRSHTINNLEAACLLSCVFSKLAACRIKIILYINPVLHGCQCFVLYPQVNVKVDSKPAVMKYSFET